jgi:hypothetical protein
MLQGSVTIRRANPDGLRQLMARLQGLSMTVGVHADQKDDKDGPMAVIAGVHEFGSQRVPARPFMRTTVWTHRPAYINTLRGALRKAIKGTMDLNISMASLGERVVREMQGTIRAQGEPANSFQDLADATVEARDARRAASGKRRMGKRRQSANNKWTGHKALIDTGRLINSIRWVLNLDGQSSGGGARSGGRR